MKIIKNKNFNNKLLLKRKAIFKSSIFLVLFFVFSYSLLLFSNVQYVYLINNSKKELRIEKNFNTNSKAKYLSQILELEQKKVGDNRQNLKNIVYLNINTKSVAFLR